MVLLVVDTQKHIVTKELYCYERFVNNVYQLISRARQENIEVIFIRHDDGEGKPLTVGTDGFEIFDVFAPTENEKIFDKRVNSPFRDTGLLEYLKSKGTETIIAVGLQTDYCMDATIKCGFEHGFEMIVPEYANSTFDNEFMTAEDTYKYYNEFMWNGRYAKCVSIEETFSMIEK